MAKADLPEYFNRSMGVIPGYREIFEAEPSVERLLAILNRYPVMEWLSFLSRMQILLAPPHHVDQERIVHVFKGVMGRKVAARVVAWKRNSDPHMITPLFTEPQMSTLQQLAILHAPAEGNRQFESVEGEGFDDLCEALLLTWDLMCPEPNPQEISETIAALYQHHLRRLSEDALVLGCRALHLYQIERRSPSAAVAKLRRLFRRATGFDLSDYLAGGLSVAFKEVTRLPDEIANGWTSTALPTRCPNPLEARCLAAFHALRCKALPEVREEIKRFDGDRSIETYSLIGVRANPIIEMSDGNRFVTNLPALFESLFGGVRHAIVSAARDGGLPETNFQELGGDYGVVFEDYVIGLLERAFPDRFIRLGPELGRGYADGLIMYPDRLVLIEIKGAYLPESDKRRRKSFEERRLEIDKLGISKAAKQLANTIRALWSRRLIVPELGYRDWTVIRVVPVIVTIEQLMLIWKTGPFYAELTQPLADLGGTNPVAPVRFLHVGEVELLPDLAAEHNFSLLLNHWAHSKDFCECPFRNFLNWEDIHFESPFWKQRAKRLLQFLREHFDLDTFEQRVAKAG